MNRLDLQRASHVRLKEAGILFRAGSHAGAYYLAGYAVECALKACIAKQTRRHDFPDKELAQKSWDHNLEKLARLAGLAADMDREMKATPDFASNWAVVINWSVSSRYETQVDRQQASDMIAACNSRAHGVLPWIRRRW